MKSVSMVYNDPFQRLLQAVEQSSENISKDLHVVICHQPYSLRVIANLSDSEHDPLRLQCMSHFVDFNSTLLDQGSHGCMISSALQFNTWNELLIWEVEEVLKHEAVLVSQDPTAQSKPFS